MEIRFASKLNELRKFRKLTQKELADKIGATSQNVSDWENGKARPSYEMLVTIANFFDVSLEEILL